MLNHIKTEAQLALEAESISLGIDRYQAALSSGGETKMAPGMRLLREAVIPLTEAIEAFQKDALSGRPGRDVGRAKFISQFDAQNVAYLTAKYCINALNETTKVQSVAMAISGMLEDSLNYDSIKASDPLMYRRLLNKIAKSSSPKYRHVIMRHAQNRAKIDTIKWDRPEKLALGLHLVRLMEQVTGYFTLDTIYGGKDDTPLALIPNPDTQAWLEQSHAHCELLNPIYLPMVIPPTPWESCRGGGYLTRPLRYHLVKARNRNLQEEMKSWDMPIVFKAVNALQNTAWRINKTVLSVMGEVWDGGSALGGLPCRDDTPPPAQTYSDPEANPEAHKAWRREAAANFESNFKLRGKRRVQASKVRIAKQFENEEAIYFPHVLDWRGRIYPVSAYLNPQSDDAGKALLQFAEGKALGPNGHYWLAIHGANCAGVDKVSFEERVQWVQDHHAEILDSAFNPLDGQRFWVGMDAPYQFLAFCKEWAGYSMQGEGYVSHLPVSWDGSCNGLQNFSAMLKDEVGGKATNLIPSEVPSDIYTEVSKEAERIVADDVGASVEFATDWQGKICRSLAKRPTMTKPYGASKFGFRDQIAQELVKLDAFCLSIGEGSYLESTDTFKSTVYLAAVMEEAIGNVVIKAKEAMDWLKEVAKVAAKDGLPIYWTTPSGFLVVQDYRQYEGKRIDTVICGVRTQLTLNQETDRLDTRKQAQGIAPNFIHSMDASHLANTVGRCVDAGITSLAMIHDSYGTHAADADRLSMELREAFIEQYTPDVLGTFKTEIEAQLPDKLVQLLPPMPTFGTLDLAGVRDSKYFFA